MNELCNDDELNHSINLIKDINLNEKDLEEIHGECKGFFKRSEVAEIFERIIKNSRISSNEDVDTILNKISNELKPKDLKILVKNIANRDDILDQIQDKILDKLLSEC